MPKTKTNVEKEQACYEAVLAQLTLDPTPFSELARRFWTPLAAFSQSDIKRQLDRLQAEGKATIRYGFGWHLTEAQAKAAPKRIDHGEFIVELSIGDEPNPEFVTVDHPLVRIAIYRHEPTDGGASYLVADFDSESDTPPLRVYVNDATVYTTEND